jgi:hypothetical protein
MRIYSLIFSWGEQYEASNSIDFLFSSVEKAEQYWKEHSQNIVASRVRRYTDYAYAWIASEKLDSPDDKDLKQEKDLYRWQSESYSEYLQRNRK